MHLLPFQRSSLVPWFIKHLFFILPTLIAIVLMPEFFETQHAHASDIFPPIQIFSSFVVTQPSPQEQEILKSKYEVVKIQGTQRAQGTDWEVYVPQEKSQEFLRFFPLAKLKLQDIREAMKEQLRNNPKILSPYHDFKDVQNYLQRMKVKYPNLVTVENYGRSKQGHPLSVMKIRGEKRENASPSKILLDSATHGDELITVEILLLLVDELLQGYGSEERMTRMLDTHEIFVVFVVNPDGFITHDRYDNGVDPNRDYPGPHDPHHQPQTAIKDFIGLLSKHQFAASLSFHSNEDNYGAIMYPWAYTHQLPTDFQFYDHLTAEMATASGYEALQINRYAAVYGSSADYHYWKYQTKALGIELKGGLIPPATELPHLVAEIREMFWKFIETF